MLSTRDQKIELNDGQILNNILSFFNIKEIASLRSLSKDWKYYIEKQLISMDEVSKIRLNPYIDQFNLYRRNNEFIIKFHVKDFFSSNPIKLKADIPFTQECALKAVGSLVLIDINFWSPDGINYFLMHTQQGCHKEQVDILKFSGMQENCIIEYSDTKANVYRISKELNELQTNNLDASNSDATDEEDSLEYEVVDFNPLELCIALEQHKKLTELYTSFERCNTGLSELVLHGLSSNRFKLHINNRNSKLTPNPLDETILNHVAFEPRRQWPG